MYGHFQEFEDEYMETLYEFYEESPLDYVRNGDLAKKLGVKPASATEMVQRLASKGFLEYVPYKGAKLTKQGIEYGKKMKRRHRLAEVLLDIIPFDGDPHATACRLEHAIDDDLDIALDTMLGSPQFDPSGREIPPLSQELKQKQVGLNQKMISLSGLNEGEKGVITVILAQPEIVSFLSENGIEIGSSVNLDNGIFTTENGQRLELSLEIAKCIMVILE